MSPEQARGEAVDHRTDLFSLGSVLYAMCTGRPPFRASNTHGRAQARLRGDADARSARSTPTIPDWLVAIIDKLHAKDPAERFQSAAEVAELLSRHLAHVQHPSAVRQLPAVRRSRSPVAAALPSRSRRLLWAAAAVLLCAVAAARTDRGDRRDEARHSVIRMFTPDGTLVVEVDDPGVKVTVEGDGGLVITGAGPEEVRLPAGQLHGAGDEGRQAGAARRNWSRSLAAASRSCGSAGGSTAGGRGADKRDAGAFVLLGGKGVAERKFDTLAEAVQGASDGDTIEIRGNGPFVSQPVNIQRTALTIRAGAGFRPVIKLSPEAIQQKLPC